MSDEDRLDKIFNIIKKKKRVSNNFLVEELHCSLSTLRRDLIKLENKKLIKRAYGEVHLNSPSNTEFSYSYREMDSIVAKQAIAELARDYVDNGMCIFIDSSSTSQYLCQLLQGIPNMVIVTNGLKNATILNDDQSFRTRIYSIGGELKPNSNSAFNIPDSSIFSHFNYDYSFFSCRGIDLNGVYEASLGQAILKEQIMKQSKNSILLVDDSKFDSAHFFKIGDFSDYFAVVTNTEPLISYQEALITSETEFIWKNPKLK